MDLFLCPEGHAIFQEEIIMPIETDDYCGVVPLEITGLNPDDLITLHRSDKTPRPLKVTSVTAVNGKTHFVGQMSGHIWTGVFDPATRSILLERELAQTHSDDTHGYGWRV